MKFLDFLEGFKFIAAQPKRWICIKEINIYLIGFLGFLLSASAYTGCTYKLTINLTNCGMPRVYSKNNEFWHSWVF